jgi:hypothetical protein
MIHKWSILCKKASIEKTTNVMSLYDILEKITIGSNAIFSMPKTLPDSFVMPFDFELVTFISDISKKNKNPLIKIELFNAQKEKMGATENKLNIPAGSKNLRSRVISHVIKIKGEGVYTFKVSLKESEEGDYKEVAEIPLEVEIAKQSS